jgi:hypothetical protein
MYRHRNVDENYNVKTENESFENVAELNILGRQQQIKNLIYMKSTAE